VLTAPLLEEQGQESTVQSVEMLSELLKLGGVSDEKGNMGVSSTTPTTCSGGLSPTSMCHTSSFSSYSSYTGGPAFFTDTLHSDTSIDFGPSTSASNVMTFAKTVDKQFAKIYESRLRAMVKEEQKKSRKRVA